MCIVHRVLDPQLGGMKCWEYPPLYSKRFRSVQRTRRSLYGRLMLQWGGSRMRRRDFITLLGGAAAAWPCNGLAQSQPRRPLIGFLGASSKAAGARYYSGFALGMRDLGY